jgi:hypothetical protein
MDGVLKNHINNNAADIYKKHINNNAGLVTSRLVSKTQSYKIGSGLNPNELDPSCRMRIVARSRPGWVQPNKARVEEQIGS